MTPIPQENRVPLAQAFENTLVSSGFKGVQLYMKDLAMRRMRTSDPEELHFIDLGYCFAKRALRTLRSSK